MGAIESVVHACKHTVFDGSKCEDVSVFVGDPLVHRGPLFTGIIGSKNLILKCQV